MIEKYILTTGLSIIEKVKIEDTIEIEITTDIGHALEYPTIGRAMSECAAINELLGHACFSIKPVYRCK